MVSPIISREAQGWEFHSTVKEAHAPGNPSLLIVHRENARSGDLPINFVEHLDHHHQ